MVAEPGPGFELDAEADIQVLGSVGDTHAVLSIIFLS